MAKSDMIKEETYNEILNMLKRKETEMVKFLNRYMSDHDRQRIGEDIIRIMPNGGDLANIQMKLLIK